MSSGTRKEPTQPDAPVTNTRMEPQASRRASHRARQHSEPGGLRDSATMVSWSEVGADAPGFATRVEQALTRNKHMTMATLRADGGPRISGTELEVSDGELWLGSMPNAR